VSKKKAGSDLPQVRVKTRAAWRRWLEKNHASTGSIWLVIDKKTSGGKVAYGDAVEEGLCFGWVDSRTRPLDDRSYMLLFSPRKPKSGWSRTNKERVERLIASGRMAEPGLAKIEAAKRDGSWSSLDTIENLEIPPDLAAALDEDAAARAQFESFTRSARKIILIWIATAKRPETRARRIEETVRLAAMGIRATHPDATGRA
jgi:uncharacterized protein YdeI (YjbR/CyaY-like superfamily)